MRLHDVVVAVHVLSATVWTGGHLVLALTVLPRALRGRDVQVIREFEAGFERIGIPALVLQVVTGVVLAGWFLPPALWLEPSSPMSRAVMAKLALLAVTAGLAVDARVRLIPRLTADRLPALAAHIIPVTVVSVLFVLVGVSFRFGGL